MIEAASDQRSIMSRIGSILLSITAVIGVVCVGSTVAAMAFDAHPLVFRSGSMSPSIDTGALAVARTTPAGDLVVGDVVSVIGPGGDRITHRIQSMTLDGGNASLVLKGDANAEVDAAPYEVTSAERVLFDVPRLGYAVAWASGPPGLLLIGAVVAVSLLIIVVSSLRSNDAGARRAVGVMVVLALGSGIALRSGPQDTLGSFTDNASLKSSSVSTFKVPVPVVTCGAASLASIRINWTAVPNAVAYVLSYGPGGNTKATVGPGTSSQTFSGIATSGKFSVQAQVDVRAGNRWTSDGSNSVNYSVVLLVLGSCG